VIQSASDQSFGDFCIIFITVLVLVFKLSVLAVTHHEQVPLQLLLLVRVQLTFLIIAVILFFFSVLRRVTLFLILLVIVTETCLVSLFALSDHLTITKVCLREILVRPDKHLLLLSLLGGDSLSIELVCIKLHNSIVTADDGFILLGLVALRLILVLEVRSIFLRSGGTCRFMSRSSFSHRVFSEEWVCSRSLAW